MSTEDIRTLLTAHADGQLGPEGRRLVERRLAADPALREELSAIRATQAGLRDLLAAAPLPTALGEEHRARLREELRGAATPGRPRAQVIRLAALRAAVFAAAASLVAVFAWLVGDGLLRRQVPLPAGAGDPQGIADADADRGGYAWEDAAGWRAGSIDRVDGTYSYREQVGAEWECSRLSAAARDEKYQHEGVPVGGGVKHEVVVPGLSVRQLEVEADELATEDPEVVRTEEPKGREEALAACETGDTGTFMGVNGVVAGGQVEGRRNKDLSVEDLVDGDVGGEDAARPRPVPRDGDDYEREWRKSPPAPPPVVTRPPGRKRLAGQGRRGRPPATTPTPSPSAAPELARVPHDKETGDADGDEVAFIPDRLSYSRAPQEPFKETASERVRRVVRRVAFMEEKLEKARTGDDLRHRERSVLDGRLQSRLEKVDETDKAPASGAGYPDKDGLGRDAQVGSKRRQDAGLVSGWNYRMKLQAEGTEVDDRDHGSVATGRRGAGGRPPAVRQRDLEVSVPCPGCPACTGSGASLPRGHVQLDAWNRVVTKTVERSVPVVVPDRGTIDILAEQARLLAQGGVTLSAALAREMHFAAFEADALTVLMTEHAGSLPLVLEEGTAFPPVALPAAAAPVGDRALQTVRLAGLQALPVGDRLLVRDPVAPLDPTSTYGLAADDFAAAFRTRPMTATAEDARVTFAFDADTASYDRCRMLLGQGQAVDPGSVRVEHFVNAMPMEYPPATGPEAFALYAEAAPAPFAAGPAARRTLLVSVGAVAREAGPDERRPLNLTLCLDASGSMARPGGLDRVRAGLKDLIGRLGPADGVALVVFDDRARLVAAADDQGRRDLVLAGIDGLVGSGATNAAEGLALAYQVAAERVAPGTESRVLFVTDGATLAGEGAGGVLERIRRYRAKGVRLTIIGCGERPAAADELERLADAGDGEHLFVADAAQAGELFASRLVPARLGTLAKDAKIQVTWNPRRVSHHRLVGYEERRLAHHQFRDDRVDAGEISHATQASALFEVVLTEGGTGELGSVAVRYFDTRYETVRELARPLGGGIVCDRPGPRLRLLACAAATGEWLRGGWWSNVRCLDGFRIRRELDRLGREASPAVRRAAAQLHRLLDAGLDLYHDDHPPRGSHP